MPAGYVPEIPIANSSQNATVRTASGDQLEYAGQRTTEYKHGDGGSVNVNFEVADVTTPLVAFGELQRRGMMVLSLLKGSFVTRCHLARPAGGSVELEHSNGAYWMRLTKGENGTKVLAPIEMQWTRCQ